jgi:tetratricopeptide (TPR) repeat protein
MRWLLAAGVVAIGGALGWSAYLARSTPPAPASLPRVARMRPIQPAFSQAEFEQFLSDAHRAEAIEGPLERCLAYPEPPGVHWSKAVTAAYCHYLRDPAISAAEVRALIEKGQATELERRLADAKQAQLTQPGAQNLLDRTYNIVFADWSDGTRALIDAWKRQSPDSAYALAASGVAYVAMAQHQRGSDYASKTRQSAFDDMHRLLQLARADLDHAVAKDPQLTPAYGAMIYTAALEDDDRYALQAVRRGLAADPASYPIYARTVWMSQPKWGGDVPQMQHFVDQAQQHAGQNPLLRLLLSERTGGEAYVEDCVCDPAAEEELYRHVFAEAAPTGMLMSAGWGARNRNNLALSVIYRSELLRFDAGHIDHRESRAFDLIQLGQLSWGLAEGNALVKQAPQDETAYDVRGQAYRAMGDAIHAADDFEQALRINPTDAWTLAALGDIYVNVTHDWDKGWIVANRLLQSTPDDPSGWFLRASIQKAQPRDGLEQTVHDFAARFGADPQKQMLVPQMQAMLRR